MSSDSEVRELICEMGRRLYAKGLVAATDGNISARYGADQFICTPSGVSKGFMKPEDLVIADKSGNKVSGLGKVTSEFFTHLAAYEERPDINAVVHAHPPKAIAITLVGLSLADCLLPEVVMSLGGIPTTSYATPGTKEGNSVVREYISKCDALLLDRHGAVTVGHDVENAYFKMEKLEHAAETIFSAHLLGEIRSLGKEEVQRLYEAREAYGASGKVFPCEVNANNPSACKGLCQFCSKNTGSAVMRELV